MVLELAPALSALRGLSRGQTASVSPPKELFLSLDQVLRVGTIQDSSGTTFRRGVQMLKRPIAIFAIADAIPSGRRTPTREVTVVRIAV